MITSLRAAVKAIARANRTLERRHSKVPEIDALIDDVAGDACIFCERRLSDEQLAARRRALHCNADDCYASYHRLYARARPERQRNNKPRHCIHCGGELPLMCRRDKRTCSVRCRVAHAQLNRRGP